MKKTLTTTTREGKLTVSISTECNYFSITGRHKTKDWEESGTIFETILEYFPQLKPIVDLHLATLDGVPMYAVENGFYWLSKVIGIPQEFGPSQTPDECLRFFADLTRLTVSQAAILTGEVLCIFEVRGKDIAYEAYKSAVENLKPTWKREASEGLKFIEELP